jgi:hypothetical protein
MHSGNHFSQLEPTRARRDPPSNISRGGCPLSRERPNPTSQSRTPKHTKRRRHDDRYSKRVWSFLVGLLASLRAPHRGQDPARAQKGDSLTEDKPKLLLNFDLGDEALVMLFLAGCEDPEDRKAVHAMIVSENCRRNVKAIVEEHTK